LKIIPVIDILNGVAVHAVRGKRNEYQPLKSVLCNSANPLAVAAAFKCCGFKELYIADLDAILGKRSNSSVLQRIAEETGLELMVDTGVSSLEAAKHLFCSRIAKVIVGTETLPKLDFLEELMRIYGSEKIVVSVDLKQGKVLSVSEQVASMDALELAVKLERLGIGEVIVLDLARVGSGEGVDMALIANMLDRLKIRVDVGGGVRDIDDLVALSQLGVHGVLLATALHSGKISMPELKRLSLL
jgi:phosphoribosylformimino-5-aminoimidazole carboxamide ribotide isomerase